MIDPDIIFFHELACYPDRLRVLAAIQNALSSRGKAYISLNWWTSDARFRHFDDEVVVGENLHDFAEYLTVRYPDYFEIYRNKEADILVVKGGQEKLIFPDMESERAFGNVRSGLPRYRWKEAG